MSRLIQISAKGVSLDKLVIRKPHDFPPRQRIGSSNLAPCSPRVLLRDGVIFRPPCHRHAAYTHVRVRCWGDGVAGMSQITRCKIVAVETSLDCVMTYYYHYPGAPSSWNKTVRGSTWPDSGSPAPTATTTTTPSSTSTVICCLTTWLRSQDI